MSNKLIGIVNSFPKQPGIYIMKDHNEKAVYIGKAKNIRNRVRSYFYNDRGDYRSQIPYLMNEVENIDYMITKNESDALLLENSMIKTHRPKYNIRLKDDKTYSSLRLSVKENFPKLTYTRRVKEDGAAYFGPFSSQEALRRTSKIARKLFKLRDCSDTKFKRHKSRPCLSYYIKLCSAPCAGKISEQRYNEQVDSARMFLKGDRKELIRMYKKNMARASEETRYEDAAYFRDQINYLRKGNEVDSLISTTLRDKDIIGFYNDNKDYFFTVLFSRNGSIVDKSEFSFKGFTENNKQIVSEFISRFYSFDRYIPSEVLIPFEISDANFFSDWLTGRRGKKVEVISPKRGAKLNLMKLAMENAEKKYHKIKAEKYKEDKLLKALKNSLSLRSVPTFIECFDISNIQGNQSVASLVRFKNGKPEKSRYRKYKIKSVSTPNDFASIYEVLFRRCLRVEQKFWDLPNLILIDGGKGQLSAAFNAIKDCGVENEVDLAAIAKSKEYGEVDKIYVYGRKEPILLSEDKKDIYLLMRIRDEAHRFAISYHKELRHKEGLSSELDTVPGIGKKRKLLLLNHFGSVEKIKAAKVEEIAVIKGLNIAVAESLKKYL